MRGLLFLGSLAAAAGACYLVCKAVDELTDFSNYTPNSFDNTWVKSELETETYSAVVTKEWITTKTRDLFNNTAAQKVSIIDLKYMDSLKDKFKDNFSQYVKDGYDYLLIQTDGSGKIFKIDVVKNLFGDDEELKELLGDEHMLVINK